MKTLHTISGKDVKGDKSLPFTTHHQILIIGGGSAGITVAAQLRKKLSENDIAIIEPSEVHYYQPMWTFNAAGVFNKEKSKKLMEDVIPKNVAWIKDSVVAFHPDQNSVETAGGRIISYEYLVVAPGIQVDWDKVDGLAENLGTNGICSIYSYRSLDYVQECIKNTKSGTALFTQPNTKFKCGGAPQKIMYLASDTWRKRGDLNNINVQFTTGGSVIFGVKEVAEALGPVVKRYGVEPKFFHNLKAIKAEKKIAVYDIYKDGKVTDQAEIKFDMLHVTPPQSSPDFIKMSPLADAEGWVDVDKHSLQHNKYPNIFSLGDAGSTPNAKTGAAVRKQSRVVTGNLVALLKSGTTDTSLSYDGYGSCPLITGFGKLILAEFDYNNKITPSFPINQMKERRSMYHMKKDLLPIMYWEGMLKGRA
ncbi:MAG: NAD(P)/FAD-dependent oxidoreductase [Balneolaceae bacterium]|nr:NAD(P)/FAD-dependent oxidoreductase [Balneolaceae bacterium]